MVLLVGVHASLIKYPASSHSTLFLPYFCPLVLFLPSTYGPALSMQALKYEHESLEAQWRVASKCHTKDWTFFYRQQGSLLILVSSSLLGYFPPSLPKNGTGQWYLLKVSCLVGVRDTTWIRQPKSIVDFSDKQSINMFCMLHILYDVFLQSSRLEQRKCYSGNHKRQCIYSIYRKRNPCISGPMQLKSLLFKGQPYYTGIKRESAGCLGTSKRC